MQTSVEATYLDPSALVKLVIPEAESEALTRFLAGRPLRVSSALARAEVTRAVLRYGPDAVGRAQQLVRRLRLVALDNELLDRAAYLQPAELRTLDAIHLASAQTLGLFLREVVTYDQRMAQAASNLGLAVVAPGR